MRHANPTPRRRRRRLLVAGLLATSLIPAWFLLVHDLHWLDSCNQCQTARRRTETRVAGFTVSRRLFDDDRNTITEIADAIGHPCPHHLRSQLRHRLWGRRYCYRPCINGMTSVLSVRTPIDRAAWVRWAAEHPDRAAAFAEAVWEQGDLSYTWTVAHEVDGIIVPIEP